MKKKFIYSFMIAAAAAAFSSCSNFVATIGFLVIIFPSDLAPHTQYGKSGGQVHLPYASNIAFLTALSSKE